MTTARPIRIRLELPFFSKKEARVRGIDGNLSRLLVGFGDQNAPVDLIATYLLACCPSGLAVYITAISEFVSLRPVLERAEGLRIESIAGNQFARVEDARALAFLLDHWKAEQLVVLFGAQGLDQPSVFAETKWWKWSTEGNESPFLKNLSKLDPVVFYSQTDDSLEMIGSEPAVIACFEIARNVR